MGNDMMNMLAQRSKREPGSFAPDMSALFGLTDLFSVSYIPIDKLRTKSNHPFKVKDDFRLSALAENIKERGLLQPIIVRPIEDGFYEILAGHRRTAATAKNGEKTIKAIIVEVDDETSNTIMICTNFQQREFFQPSEIARSYRIRYTDLKNRRKKENSNGWNSDEQAKIDQLMEAEFSASKSKIYMYLRLNHLTDKFLDALDESRLNLKVATELSYLDKTTQENIYILVYKDKLFKLDRKKAVQLRKESVQGALNVDEIQSILSKSEITPKETLDFSNTEINRYRGKFSSVDAMKKAILEFLDNYK